eukprot:scaffold239268_cov36-Prasinocladus_malaysianus.AAC.1
MHVVMDVFAYTRMTMHYDYYVYYLLNGVSNPSCFFMRLLAVALTGSRNLLEKMSRGTSHQNLTNILDFLEMDGTDGEEELALGRQAFCGLRVRMGVHTAHVEDARRHPTTNRVIYPHGFIHTTELVQKGASGGQVVISSDTLSAITWNEETKYGSIVHLGSHLLEEARARASSRFSAQEDSPSQSGEGHPDRLLLRNKGPCSYPARLSLRQSL